MDAWWARLRELYSEDGRHYHTISHIDGMLGLQETYRDKLSEPLTVAWAIFFHDAVYNPKASDNEEQSADLFQTFAGECLPEGSAAMVSRVKELILLTKSHTTDAHRVEGMYGDGDEHYFLDFDMQVLGWEDADYDRYAQQIRQEYIHVPEQQYRAARAHILQEFLKTPNIFATKDFRDLYESQARANIQREIQQLQDG